MDIDEIVTKNSELYENIDTLTEEDTSEELFYQIINGKNLKSENTLNNSELTKLLKQEKSSYILKATDAKIIFEEPLYIKTVSFKPEKELNFEINYILINGKSEQKHEHQTNGEGKIVFSLNTICTSITLRANRRAFAKRTDISDLRVLGITLSELLEAESLYKVVKDDRISYENHIQHLKDSLIQQKNEIANLTQNYVDLIAEKEEEENRLESCIKELTDEIANKENNITKLDVETRVKNNEILSIKQSIDSETKNLTEEKRSLASTQEAHDLLKQRYVQLEKQVNLFPDTLEGFTKRAYKNKLTYLSLTAIPLLIFFSICVIAWCSAKKFADMTTLTNLEQAYIILIQRIPFSIIVISLASMCIAFIYKMVNQLNETQQQEINLSKISILAKDISDAETNGLEEAEKQEQRLQTKLFLIQQYLAFEFIRLEKLKDKNTPENNHFSLYNLPSLLLKKKKEEVKPSSDTEEPSV